MSAKPPFFSIVVPVYNEQGNAVVLAHEIAKVFADSACEIIFVDDASTDETRPRLMAAKADIPALRLLAHEKNAGQSRAIRTGAFHARGDVLCVLDGDGQNDPADLPSLIEHFMAGGPALGMIGGVRQKRQDKWSKRIGSSFANALRRRLLDDQAVDAGCGLKVMRLQTYLCLPFFDHQHRYISALVLREGLDVAFYPVSHRPRLSGRSKYSNMGRLLVSFRDLLGVMWLRARSRKPGKIREID